jgi:hypothetical protein
MSRIPLRWATGDRCAWRGRVGIIVHEPNLVGFHVVRFPGRVFAIIRVEDLELVPLANLAKTRGGDPSWTT